MPADHNDNRDRYAFIALIALIVWAPLPLGSNRVWAWSILEVGSFLTLACWVIGYSRRQSGLAAVKAARAPLFILLAWASYILLQATPLPQNIVAMLSPYSHAAYQFNLIDNGSVWIPISVDRGTTLAQFLKGCSCIAIFFLILLLVDNLKRLKIAVGALITVGVIESLYGLFNTLTGIEYIWWSQKTAHQGFVTGTFANRNHFAGHLEMIIPLAIGMLISRGPKARISVGKRFTMAYLISSLLERRAQLVVLILIMFTALFLSYSYAGIISLLTALTITIGFSYIIKGKGSHEARIAPMILTAAIFAGLIIGSGWFTDRLATTPTQAELTQAWATTKNIIHDFFITGSGAGTLQYIFPMYEDGSLYVDFNHAHNDYLEILSEQGIIGFTLLAVAIIILLIKIGMASIKSGDMLIRGVLFASLTGAIAILFHGFVDFNFQIPANSLYFFTLLALGISAGSLQNRQTI